MIIVHMTPSQFKCAVHNSSSEFHKWNSNSNEIDNNRQNKQTRMVQVQDYVHDSVLSALPICDSKNI